MGHSFSPAAIWPARRKGLLAVAAQFERAEVLEPRPRGDVRSGFQPTTEPIEVVEADVAVAHSIDQMVAEGGGNARPAFNLRHYSPKTKRPSWSPSCFASSGLLALRKRSARSKNAFSFCFRASMPNSMSSTSTRLSLKRWLFAMRSTCLAIGAGRDTLRRTCFVTGIPSLYTSVVHCLPAPLIRKKRE